MSYQQTFPCHNVDRMTGISLHALMEHVMAGVNTGLVRLPDQPMDPVVLDRFLSSRSEDFAGFGVELLEPDVWVLVPHESRPGQLLSLHPMSSFVMPQFAIDLTQELKPRDVTDAWVTRALMGLTDQSVYVSRADVPSLAGAVAVTGGAMVSPLTHPRPPMRGDPTGPDVINYANERIYVTYGITVSGFHCEEAGVDSAHVLMEGYLKVYVVIEPEDNGRFLALLEGLGQTHFPDDPSWRCRAAYRSCTLLIGPARLRRAHIRFRVVVLRHDLLFFLRGNTFYYSITIPPRAQVVGLLHVAEYLPSNPELVDQQLRRFNDMFRCNCGLPEGVNCMLEARRSSEAIIELVAHAYAFRHFYRFEGRQFSDRRMCHLVDTAMPGSDCANGAGSSGRSTGSNAGQGTSSGAQRANPEPDSSGEPVAPRRRIVGGIRAVPCRLCPYRLVFWTYDLLEQHQRLFHGERWRALREGLGRGYCPHCNFSPTRVRDLPCHVDRCVHNPGNQNR